MDSILRYLALLSVAFASDRPPPGSFVAESMPPAVVVHKRRGTNSGINGVYSLVPEGSGSYGKGLCYRRGGFIGKPIIFLCFEGEWRISPSPEEGAVWAFARSSALSPLLIDAPWEVWDGKRVHVDQQLRISDTSVIPAVIFMTLATGVPDALQAFEGMLLQQPGLWDGRPYYRHRTFEDLFLLCSVAEGRWRFGPLPFAEQCGAVRTPLDSCGPLMFSHSAAAMPHEIVELWLLPGSGNTAALAEGAVRLATTMSSASVNLQQPRHLVVEGFYAAQGAANGVYRMSDEVVNNRPVYRKTDALRPASIWYAGDEWRLGPKIDEQIWAYSPSTAPSPLLLDAFWFGPDGMREASRILDANDAIPDSFWTAGDRYVQQPRLCDARPVYRREAPARTSAVAPQEEIFLFFRAHESEWWLGPVVGGKEFIARSRGSRLTVAPNPAEFLWQYAAAGQKLVEVSPSPLLLHDFHPLSGDSLSEPSESFSRLPVVVISILLLLLLLVACASNDVHKCLSCEVDVPNPSSRKTAATLSRRRGLDCVVCLEAPREVLLYPCRHVCCCQACADRLQRCPMCRAEKTAFTQVFL